jgi:hypothetical protein
MKQKEFNEYLAIFAGISIPLFTILFATEKSPFQYTLSMIGNWFDFDDRVKFIIWGILTSTLLVIFIIHIFKKTRFKNERAYRFLYASGLLLMLSVLTPTITRQPIPKELRSLQLGFHEIFGLLFAITLIISLYLFTRYLSSKEEEFSIKPLRALIITVGGSILVLTLFGMTGIFELFFFISLTVFLWIIELNTRKDTKKIEEEYFPPEKNKQINPNSKLNQNF